MGNLWCSQANEKEYFNGKVAWVTGASSGLGRELAICLSSLGCRVVLSARGRKNLEKVKEECIKAYEKQSKNNSQDNDDKNVAVIIPIDLAKFNESEKGFENEAKQVFEIFGRIDFLINNAGLSSRSRAMDSKIDVDIYLMNVNFFGTVALTKSVLPYMINKRSGHIGIVNSIQGKIGLPSRTSYSASKHAVTGYFDSLRAELASDNIFVTSIYPGYIKTNLSKNAMTGSGESHNQMDVTTSKGMDPLILAQKILSAIAHKENEKHFIPFDARLGMFLRYNLTNVYFWYMAKKAKKEFLLASKNR